MTTTKSRRKTASIILGCVLLVLLFTFAALNAFNNFLNPVSTGEGILFIGLSFVAFLLFIVVLVLLVRNVLKLYADQRSRVMGTRLRTRMLWGAVLVSFIPIVFMFLFSYGLMNRAVDRWFSQNPNEIRDDSTRLAMELAQYTSANARAEAQSIAAAVPLTTGSTRARTAASTASAENPDPRDVVAAANVLQEHEVTLQGGFAAIYREGHSVASYHMPQRTGPAPRIRTWLPESSTDEDEPAAPRRQPYTSHLAGDFDATLLSGAQRTDLPIVSVGDTDYALGTAPLPHGGTVLVALPMPFHCESSGIRKFHRRVSRNV